METHRDPKNRIRSRSGSMIPPRSYEPWFGVVRMGLNYWGLCCQPSGFSYPGTWVGARYSCHIESDWFVWDWGSAWIYQRIYVDRG